MKYYIICSCPRSGSNLLAESLKVMGAGKPDEYFNRIAAIHSTGGGTLGVRENFMLPTPEAYIERLKRQYAVNGIFSIKTHYKHFAAVPGIVVRPENFFPNAQYISITRRNFLRQIISAARAAQTQAWTSQLPEQKHPRLHYLGLIKHAIVIAQEIELWEKFYAAHGIKPLRILYEDLDEAYESTMKRVTAFLGISGDIPPPPLKKQADALTEAWVSRCVEFFRGSGYSSRIFRSLVERW